MARYGPRVVLLAGLLTAAAGYVPLLFLSADGSPVLVALGTGIVGCGMGLTGEALSATAGLDHRRHTRPRPQAPMQIRSTGCSRTSARNLLGRVAVTTHGGHREVLRERRGYLPQVPLRLLLHLVGQPLRRHAGGDDGARRVRYDGDERQLRVLVDGIPAGGAGAVRSVGAARAGRGRARAAAP